MQDLSYFQKRLKIQPLNAFVLSGIVASFLTLTANRTFFEQVLAVYPWQANAGFVTSLAVVLTGILLLLISIVSFRPILKPVLIAMLFIAAVAGYFTDTYGTVYDTNMLQNALQTDGAETADLLNMKFFLRMVLLGVLPSVLVAITPVRFAPLKRRVLEHGLTLVLALALVATPVFAMSGHYASFFREHKSLRYFTNPVTPVYSAGKLVSMTYERLTRPTELIMHATDAKRAPIVATRKPRLVVMVLGETARADHVSFNGYQRETFPRLSQMNGLANFASFTNVTACGTSTAYSVPCMFSYLGADDYDVDTARYQENVMDTLARLGVGVIWRDNNSDDKDVLERLPETFADYKSKQNNPHCSNEFNECRDTGMLVGLDIGLDKAVGQARTRVGEQSNPARLVNGDVLIVLHQMGNHGPAYFKRYDEKFAKFMPVCQSNELATCDQKSVINAYDNALLATDDFLAQTIGWLQTQTDYSTAMLYVSDHGESLGENGVYLHGMPKAFAPDAQLHVPAFYWASADMPFEPVAQNQPLSHDAITPTLLKLFDVHTQAANPDAFVSSKPE